MSNNEMMLGVDGTLNIVPHYPAASATCGHRASIGIGQRYLLVLGLHHLSVQTVQALYLLTQRRNLLVEPDDLGLRYHFSLAIGAVELREIAGDALVNLRQPPLHLGWVKFRSRVLTALNLLPSIATLASLNSSRRRHSTTNSRQTSRMASPLSLRKSAIVLKSGIRRPVSQTNSILRWHSRSRRRLDCTRLRYP